MSDSWDISIKRQSGKGKPRGWIARMELGGVVYSAFGRSESKALKALAMSFPHPLTALEIDAMRSLCLWVIDQAWEDRDGL